MDYLFLAAACFFFSIQFIFSKFFERRSDGSYSAGLWCSLANALCMLLYLFPKCGFRMTFSSSAIICALLYAVSMVACTGFSILALHCGKLAIVTAYTLLGGLVLPFFWGIIVYHEPLTLLKGIGVVILILSMVSGLLFDAWQKRKNGTKKNGVQEQKKEEKGTSPLIFHGLCLILFLANGIVSIATTASQKAADAISSDDFLLLCQVGIAVFSLLFMLIHAIREKSLRRVFVEISSKPPMTGVNFLLLFVFCALHSICNGIGNICSLNCAQIMDASIQFPVIAAVVIVMGAVLGRIFFGEKIGKRDSIGLILAALGIVFFII